MLHLGWRIRRLTEILVISCGMSTLVVGIGLIGLLQPLEWFAFDQLLRWQSTEKRDGRFLVVTVGEEDLRTLQEWPISDGKMASLLQKLNRHHPRAIGIDIYRDLPVGTGREQLRTAFQAIPNIVGIERVTENFIPPAPELDPQNQVGLADLTDDHDGRIRRGILVLRCGPQQLRCQTAQQQVKYGLATRLALIYLEQEGITTRVLDKNRLQIGQTVLRRFKAHEGGYANVDDSGTQILINYPAGKQYFDTVTLSQMLNGDVPESKIKDRIVLIGATTLSLNDLLYTPMSRAKQLPGVFIHAHIASQLIGIGLNERLPLNGVSVWSKNLWILLATTFSVALVYGTTHPTDGYRQRNAFALVLIMPCIWGSILGVVYGFFWVGLWLPVVAPLLSVSLSSILLLLKQNQQLHGLASIDGLTRIANRRSFDGYLQQCIDHHRGQLSLVLCDVDYFKSYNDTYGHQAGDRCLVSVAKILATAVRHHDFVARYGGEEFVIVLTNSKLAIAHEVLKHIQRQIAGLAIPHKASDVSQHVTLSFGVVFFNHLENQSAKTLIECADRALYQAKHQGRNQIVSAVFPMEDWFEELRQHSPVSGGSF